MANYIIETKNLTKKYGSKLAVNNVDMHVEQGTVYGFVGENGSGKSTIMRLLMGLAIPTKGEYSLFGVNAKDRKIQKVRKHISAIVEAPSLVPSLSAYDNLKYACLYYGINNYQEVIPQALKNVGLEDTGKKAAKNFSLGMKQRLGIAVLLLNNPDLMLLDEPMNGLDPSGVAELRNLIIDLNKKGITFIISSHILSELEKVATHYGFISHGKLIKEISASDLALECKKFTEKAMKGLDRNSYEYLSLRLFHDMAGESTLTLKIQNEESKKKKGRYLYYLALYWDIKGKLSLAHKYYSEITEMKGADFFEFRLAEWAQMES